jgi:hypothetical protein
METSSKVIQEIISNSKEGTLFTFSDFNEITNYESVKKTLLRLTNRGLLFRIIDGIYQYPIYDSLINDFAHASIFDVINKIAGMRCWNVIPTGESALNILKLSDKEPTIYEFLSDGPSVNYHIYEYNVKLIHASNKLISKLSYYSAIVVSAFKTLGKDNIDENIIYKLRLFFPEKKRLEIIKETRNVTVWIHEKIKLLNIE